VAALTPPLQWDSRVDVAPANASAALLFGEPTHLRKCGFWFHTKKCRTLLGGMNDRSTNRSRNSDMRKVRQFPFVKLDPEVDEKSGAGARVFTPARYKKKPRGHA
jgi:hypothetical protein